MGKRARSCEEGVLLLFFVLSNSKREVPDTVTWAAYKRLCVNPGILHAWMWPCAFPSLGMFGPYLQKAWLVMSLLFSGAEDHDKTHKLTLV